MAAPKVAASMSAVLVHTRFGRACCGDVRLPIAIRPVLKVRAVAGVEHGWKVLTGPAFPVYSEAGQTRGTQSSCRRTLAGWN